MDDRRFDAMARALARGTNRRQMLAGLLGLGGAAASGRVFDARAARRPSPTPKPVSCPGQQVWDGSACVCPGGTDKCGPDCCPVGEAECCDGACCFGTCYGEELCCPPGSLFCDGSCGAWECCNDDDCASGVCDPETHTCLCTPNCEEDVCGDDGCGGVCNPCGSGYGCIDGQCFLLYPNCGVLGYGVVTGTEYDACLCDSDFAGGCTSTANCPGGYVCIITGFGDSYCRVGCLE